ncbi:MAG: hypothetical protein ACR2KV_00800 [Solirubrobacteraceae bacterium]
MLASALRRRPPARAQVAGLAAVVWMAGASAARSDTDYGTVGVDAKSYGSIVSLSTPSSRLFQENDEFVVHRDVVQSSFTAASPGLIQAGVYRSGPGIELDNCGARAGYTVFTEVKAFGSMAYRCQLFGAVSPGTVVTFDIFRFSTPATWGIRINGGSTGSVYRLSFNQGGPAIGSEITDVDTNYATQTATRFGVAGGAAWSVYRRAGRAGAHRVTGADPTDPYPTDDPHWVLPQPPARMTIRHRQ